MAFNKFFREVKSFDRFKQGSVEQKEQYLNDYDIYLESSIERLYDYYSATHEHKESYSKNSESKSDYGREAFAIYLKVLEFESLYNITFDQIRKRYKQLARRYHPDSATGDEYRFKLIREAYEYLENNYPK
ncbi:hypothetical protein EVJ26_11105 [Exiguobacterium sp. SH3S1]|nr:hypothetical protein EVJ26_11105 [Exiguobacterium sp. SH3S1]